MSAISSDDPYFSLGLFCEIPVELMGMVFESLTPAERLRMLRLGKDSRASLIATHLFIAPNKTLYRKTFYHFFFLSNYLVEPGDWQKVWFSEVVLTLADRHEIFLSTPFWNQLRLYRIYAFAGIGQLGVQANAKPALLSPLHSPSDICLWNDSVVICDTQHHRICTVTPDGLLVRIAGTGTSGGITHGRPAKQTPLNHPSSCAVDREGNLLICDRNNHAVRKLDFSTGLLTTVAGGGGAGFSGDCGPATAAQLNYPTFVRLAPDGVGFLIEDARNRRVRRVENGIITTVVGNGTTGSPRIGSRATQTGFGWRTWQLLHVGQDGTIYLHLENRLYAVKNEELKALEDYAGRDSWIYNTSRKGMMERDGRLWIADARCVRVFDPETKKCVRVVGTGEGGNAGNGGAAGEARLLLPTGLCMSGDGAKWWIVDEKNHCVRVAEAVFSV